jgi:hypothetical protein
MLTTFVQTPLDKQKIEAAKSSNAYSLAESFSTRGSMVGGKANMSACAF